VCGREFEIGQYLEEINEEMWEAISRRSCNRV
jgi:hypothetical protein